MLRYLIFALIATSVACTETKTSKNNAPLLPEALTERPVTSRPALSALQSDELARFSRRAALIPDASLMLISRDESEGTKTRRAKKVNDLQGYERQIYLNLISRCQIIAPVTKSEGDWKEPGSTQTDVSTAAITGAGCAIDYRETQTVVLTKITSNQSVIEAQYYQSKDPKVLEAYAYSAKSTSEGTKSMVIRDLNLRQQSGIRLIETSDAAITFTSGGYKASDQHSKSTAKFRLTTVDGQIVTYTILVENLIRGNKRTAYIEFDMQLPSSNPILQLYMDGATQRFFLNGLPTTTAALKSLFGDQFNVTLED